MHQPIDDDDGPLERIDQEQVETKVECPRCQKCIVCHGTGVVTLIERNAYAAQVASGMWREDGRRIPSSPGMPAVLDPRRDDSD